MVAQGMEKSYLCIDLKSFYASVECADRGLDPFLENLVVADPDRGPGTICLAITPAMKALGVKNRCRVFEIPNGIEYTMATPRMRRYMEASAEINGIYMHYVSPEDMHVYSIDECFIDATPYLRLYDMGAREFASFLRRKVMEETGITATAGIGTNLFLAKVALDIEAKKAADGIGILDEESYKREIWFHHPITDIWQVGPGIAHRLARKGILDMAGVCAANPEWLRKELGKNGEYLLDHAWGQEPCTIKEIKGYRPSAHSISNGQVLMRDYGFGEARTVLREMIDASCLDLYGKGLSCGNVSVHVGYAQPSLTESGRWATGSGGTVRIAGRTDSPHQIREAALAIYDSRTSREAPIRRLSVALGQLQPARLDQPSLFDDPESDKEAKLSKASIAVRERFGKNALLRGTSLKEGATMRERNNQVGGHRA